MRWVLNRGQVVGTFSEPIDWPDGTVVFMRLQYRETGMSPNGADWKEIPIESEIAEVPKIELVHGRGH